MKRIIGILTLALFALGTASAQRMPERHLVRKGNRQFAKEKYDKSIESYTRATEAAPTSFEAAYNLGNALFRAGRYDGAQKALERIAADSTLADTDRADAAYNLGNVQFQQQKLKEALSSYRKAMRLNPADEQAKYNYAYTKRLLQEQEQNQDNKDNNKDNKDNQENKDNQNQEGQDKDNQQQQQGDQDQQQQEGQDKQEGDNDQQQGEPQEQQGDKDGRQGEQPAQGGISEQEREAMLEAIQAQEDKTQDKLKEKTGVVIRGKKNW